MSTGYITNKAGIELGPGATQLRLNIVFIIVFNIGLNIELNIELNIGLYIGFNIGV